MPGAICTNRWFFWSLEIFGLFFFSTEIRLIDNFRWRQLVKVITSFLLLLPVNWPDPFPLNLRTWVDVESSLILTQLTYNLLIFFLPFLTNATFKMSEVKWCCLKMFPDLSWVEFSILQSKVFSSVRPFSKPLMRRRSCQQNQVMQTCWNFTRFTSKPPSAIATQVHKTNWIIHV